MKSNNEGEGESKINAEILEKGDSGNSDEDTAAANESEEEAVSSDEEVDVAENEIVWVCRCCSEFNLQEKARVEKSLKSRRLGTKENAEKIKLLIHTVGKLHEHYVVEFKQLKNVNRCKKCGTPADYKPRRCAKQFFNQLEDFSEQLVHKEGGAASAAPPQTTNPLAAMEEGADPDPDAPPKPRGRQGRRGSVGGRDSILINRNKSFATAMKSKDMSCLDKVKLTIVKIKDRYAHFVDATPKEEQILFNDHEFKKHLKLFMPFVDRRKRGYQESFAVGDEIEAIERKTMWYPGQIKRVGDNGTYDIIYSNGELIETVLPVKIRYPATYALTRTARFMLINILLMMLVSPLAASSFYAVEVKQYDAFGIALPSISEPEQYFLLLAPISMFAVVSFVGMTVSYGNAFRKLARR